MDDLFTKRIFAVSGFTKTDILDGRTALDIGCGGRKLPGAVGMDVLALPGVDVVHDASTFPWPFRDGSFDLVLANHFLEHAEDMARTVSELHRILKPGGRLVVQVPYFRSTDAFSDPTHKHFFTAGSLDYFIDGSRLANYRYSASLFMRKGFWYGWPHPSKNPLKQLLKVWAHAHSERYDQYLSLLFPVDCLTWELEVIK